MVEKSWRGKLVRSVLGLHKVNKGAAMLCGQHEGWEGSKKGELGYGVSVELGMNLVFSFRTNSSFSRPSKEEKEVRRSQREE